MTGYDKSPDYGGRDWRWWDYVWTIALALLVAFGMHRCQQTAFSSHAQQPVSSEAPQ